MLGTLGMLVSHIAIGIYVYNNTKSVVSTLTAIAWSFTLYMVSKILFICLRVPKPLSYTPPRIVAPPTIDREHLPILEDKAVAAEERVVKDLIAAVITKIVHAADESAIHSFVGAKIANLRRKTSERFSNITSDVNVIGFEGIIGTLIGLITFMAQATVLFNVPELGDGKSDAFVATMIKNMNQINLLTVSTAFLTSVIGWGAKAWIGQWIDRRKGQEAASITQVESWLQDEILSRLSLPTQVKTLLEFVNLPELHRPLSEAVQRLAETSTQIREGLVFTSATARQLEDLVENVAVNLGPQLERVVMHLASIGDLQFDVKYVEGGIRLIPRSKRDTLEVPDTRRDNGERPGRRS